VFDDQRLQYFGIPVATGGPQTFGDYIFHVSTTSTTAVVAAVAFAVATVGTNRFVCCCCTAGTGTAGTAGTASTASTAGTVCAVVLSGFVFFVALFCIGIVVVRVVDGKVQHFKQLFNLYGKKLCRFIPLVVVRFGRV